jgi:hypothetical protein
VYLHAKRGLGNKAMTGGGGKMTIGIYGDDIFQLNESHAQSYRLNLCKDEINQSWQSP